MTALEVGIYIRLLCFQWGQAMLPGDLKRMAQIAHVSEDVLRDSWSVIGEKFIQTDEGQWFNGRLQSIREEQVARRDARSIAGSKGGLSNAKHLLKQNSSPRKVEGKASSKPYKASKTLSVDIVLAIPVPESLSRDENFPESWKSWLEHRTETSPYKTLRGVKAQLTKLEKIGPERASAAILHSIAGEWRAIHEPSDGNGAAKPGQHIVGDVPF